MPKPLEQEYYLKQTMLELLDTLTHIRETLARDGVALDKIVRHLTEHPPMAFDQLDHMIEDMRNDPKLSRPLPYQETCRGGTVQVSSASPDGTIVEKELKFLLSKGLAKEIALRSKNMLQSLPRALAEELQALTQFASAAETSKDSS